MIQILTSNKILSKSIKSYVDNFIFCFLHTKYQYPMNPPKLIYQFDIFYQDGMEFDQDDYSNTDTMIFKFHPVNAITTALEEISSMIVDLELDNEEQDEDLQEDNQFCVCCDYLTNQQIVQYLNHQFNELDSDTTCLNLYQYLKITDTEKLVHLVKMVLSTDFVYPDEPISFSYALYKAIKGMI